MFKRIFLVVIDSLGVGAAPDALNYKDEDANTILHLLENKNYNLNIFEHLGLTKLVGLNASRTYGYYMRSKIKSKDKSDIAGYHEMMGIINNDENIFQNGIPFELISMIKNETGLDVVGNVRCSEETAISEFGEMHLKSKSLIMFTTFDDVLEIMTHEKFLPFEVLIKIGEKVRELTNNSPYKINKICVRTITGKLNNFSLTNDIEYFTSDPDYNALDLLTNMMIPTILIGKTPVLFNNYSASTNIKTNTNLETLMKLIDFSKASFKGLCFASLSDLDAYAHNRNSSDYLKGLEEINYYLPIFLKNLKKSDLLIITSSHGNDTTYKGNEHTREYVPIMLFSTSFKESKMLEDRNTLSDISATILENYEIKNDIGTGNSILDDIEELYNKN